jgi:hypothetical protein
MKREWKIEINPILDDNDFFYRTTVFGVQRNELGEPSFEIMDIFHLNSMSETLAFLAVQFKDAGDAT